MTTAPTETILKLTLRPREENRLLAGHPWVFSNELKEVPKTAEPGCPAFVETSSGRKLGFGFFNPRSLIAFRLLAREPVALDADFFHSRLEDALALRERALPGSRWYRLCFGESDRLPGLVVDRYGEHLALQFLAAGMDRRRAEIVAALERLLSPKSIFARNDHPARRLEGLKTEDEALLGEPPETAEAEEGGLRFKFSLRHGQKSGFFFDQRENRALTAGHCRGKMVLDLHCYVGAFALAAARAGAAKVLALDSSAPAIALAKENAKANGLDALCAFDAGDAEEALESFAGMKQPDRPGLIILDPPSLVPSKRHLPQALRAYARLNALALKALPRGGILATSSCSHHVSREEFLGMLRSAAARTGRALRLIELRGQAQDHPVLLAMPETEYLHFALAELL